MQDDEVWEFDETEEPGEQEAEPTLRYEIMNYPADTTLQGYADMWDRGELTIPEFQRAYIWDQVRASKLIESFLLGLPVPGVFLFRPRDASTYLIVDGQQRIKSIISYLKGTFGDRAFRLKNVAEQWEGKKFEELSEDEQFRMKGAVLRSTIIQQIDPDDRTSIYQIFERLNTGGVNLSPMEIRQCVSFGPFIDFLKALNGDDNWRLIIGKPRPDRRLRDVELILRCLALAANADEYDKPMKGFLNDYAEMERAHPSDYEALGSAFAGACAAIVQQLGEKPFHLRGRLNYGLLDSMLTNAMHSPNEQEMQRLLEGLLGRDEYMQAITKNTSDVAEVELRLRLAAEAFGIAEG